MMEEEFFNKTLLRTAIFEDESKLDINFIPSASNSSGSIQKIHFLITK